MDDTNPDYVALGRHVQPGLYTVLLMSWDRIEQDYRIREAFGPWRPAKAHTEASNLARQRSITFRWPA